MYKLLFSNLVYGEPYTDMFLNLHLKSVIANLLVAPVANGSTYMIFTDGKNIKQILSHINFHRLQNFVNTEIVTINSELKYEQRYNIQEIQNNKTLEKGLNQDYGFDYLVMTAADLYYGDNTFLNFFNILKTDNFDSVWSVPFRTTYESTKELLSSDHKLNNDQLLTLANWNLHPCWIHGDWNSHRFTHSPYHIIWSKNDQLLIRTYSWGPLIFKPKTEMLNLGGCFDLSFDSNVESAYINSEWLDVPVIELEQLIHFCPSFTLDRASVSDVANWTKERIPSKNYINLLREFRCRTSYQIFDESLSIDSKIVASEILKSLLN